MPKISPHQIVHAIEIVGVFLAAHHFWPKGITYGEHEEWEKKHHENRERHKQRGGEGAKKNRGGEREKQGDERENRDGDKEKGKGNARGKRRRRQRSRREELQEDFIPHGIYRGDGSEFMNAGPTTGTATYQHREYGQYYTDKERDTGSRRHSSYSEARIEQQQGQRGGRREAEAYTRTQTQTQQHTQNPRYYPFEVEEIRSDEFENYRPRRRASPR